VTEHHSHRSTTWRALLTIVTVVYTVGVAALLLPSRWDETESPVNLVPFETIRMTLRLHNTWYFQLLLFNALVLIPAGVLLALWRRKMSLAVGALVIVGVAVGIEAAQWILPTGRSVDIDDVIMNASGGVIAFAATRLLQSSVRRARTAASPPPPATSDDRCEAPTV